MSNCNLEPQTYCFQQ